MIQPVLEASQDPQYDVLTDKPLTRRSFSVMRGKVEQLMTEVETEDLTLDTFVEEYKLDVYAGANGETAVGRRWLAEVFENGVRRSYEITTFFPTAQHLLKQMVPEKSRLQATVWFREEFVDHPDDANASSFGFLLSLYDEPSTYRRLPNKWSGEVTGHVTLSPDYDEDTRATLYQGAETIGAGVLFDHYAKVAAASNGGIEFLAEVPQEMGSDVVKALGHVGSIAAVDSIEQKS